MTTRREFLTSGVAVAATAVLPSVAVSLPMAAPVMQMRAWSFDIRHGDYRNTVIAATREDAHAAMIAEHFDELHYDCPRHRLSDETECKIEDCGCTDSGMSEVTHEPALDDAAARGEITVDDYHKAGWGYVCDRCGGEPGGHDWQPIDGVAVCDDCTTLDEWRAINPAHAAELEEDARIDAMTDYEFDAYEASRKSVETV